MAAGEQFLPRTRYAPEEFHHQSAHRGHVAAAEVLPRQVGQRVQRHVRGDPEAAGLAALGAAPEDLVLEAGEPREVSITWNESERAVQIRSRQRFEGAESFVLHARGTEETVFLGAETIRPLIARLVPDAQFQQRPRFSTLLYTGPRKLTRLPPRSAVALRQ